MTVDSRQLTVKDKDKDNDNDKNKNKNYCAPACRNIGSFCVVNVVHGGLDCFVAVPAPKQRRGEVTSSSRARRARRSSSWGAGFPRRACTLRSKGE